MRAGSASPERHLVGDEHEVEGVHGGEQVRQTQHKQHVALVQPEVAQLHQRRLQRLCATTLTRTLRFVVPATVGRAGPRALGHISALTVRLARSVGEFIKITNIISF